MEFEDFTEIGTIVKAHGLKGECIIDPLIDDLPPEVSLLYVASQKGQLIPHRMEKFSARSNKGRVSFFLKFEHVDSRTAAQALTGKSVFLPEEFLPEQDTDDELPDIISWPVLNGSEQFGTVADVFETPAHPVIEIHHSSGSVIIPWVDEYISSVDYDNHQIHAKHLERFL